MPSVQIGPYELTRYLGHGGMGEVWLGKRMAMGSAAKIVAVKLLRTPDAAARNNFVKEARLAMLLRHSTIVQVNDVGESEGTCFMEMEWVDGLDLSRLTAHLRETNQKLEIGVAAYVIGELLKALAFAHALDVDGRYETIVHRDITPQNVLISKSGEVKLTDFGIAFLTSDKTSSALIKGKSRYMSPEHVRQVRELCIDIFGVGAIFHEMVDGRKFRHTAESDVDLWSMAFAGDIPPLSLELPAELEQLRRGLLAPDLAERFASARAALAALRRWPGYRDASEELEELVREAAAAEVPPTATEQLPAVSIDRNDSTGPEQGDAVQPEGYETKTSSPPTWSRRPKSKQQSSRIHAAITVILALIGFVFGGVGLNVFIIQDRESQSSAGAKLSPDPAVLPSEPPKVVADPHVVVELPVAEPPHDVEPPPVVEPPPAEDHKVIAPEPADMTSQPDTTSEAKAKTEVTLVASGYPWVRIRIGYATYVLDRKSSPTKKLSLKPGTYSIAFQIDDEEPWQALGKVNIPAQPTARLVLQKPGKVVIK